MIILRANPPDTPVPSRVRRAIRHGDIPDLGKPLGAGKFGAAYKRGDAILKVTTDPYEVDVVRAIVRIRSHPPRRDQALNRRLMRFGSSIGRASTLPGFVGIKVAPKRRGKTWVYLREDVQPLDSLKDSMKDMRLAAADDALLSYFYDKNPPSSRSFVEQNPWAMEIVETAVYLEGVGLRLEDVHSEQLGIVKRSSALHRRGTIVLYDGQLG